MRIFLTNWELKVLAVLSAIIFWFLVVGTENTFYTFPEDITVKAFNVAEDLVVAEDLGTVTLRLKIDSRESIKNLSASDFSAFVDLEGMEAGERDVDVEVSSKNSEITVVKVEPKKITVKVEQRSEKEVPIEHVIKGDPKEGYQVKEVNIEQENTLVKGSQKVLDAIEQATLIIELNGEFDDISGDFPLKVINEDGEEVPNVTFEEMEIGAEVVISAITDQKIAGVQPTIIGTPDDSVWIKAINVDPSFVVISGDKETLDEIDFVQTSDIDVEDLSENKEFSVSIIGLPENVSIEGESQISISIEVENYNDVDALLQRKTVNVPVFIQKFKAFQKNIEQDSLSVILVVEGSKEALDKLNTRQKIGLDISEYESNEAIFELDENSFNLPEGVSIVSITPSKVKVTWD